MSKATKTIPEKHDQHEQERVPEEQASQSDLKRKTRKRNRRRTKVAQCTSNDPHVCMAMCVAMAHAGLALSLALLYGLTKLLQGYKRPIQWAILCSIPLRELQIALVSFWSHSLNLGLFETLIAIPISVLRATTASLIDSHAAILRLLRHPAAVQRNKKIGFSKLMQWLVSFGLLVLVYERVGLVSLPIFAIPCFVAYMMGFGAVINPGVASTLSRIKSARYNSKRFKSETSLGHRMSRCVTCFILSKLKIVIGIGLIMFMIVGSVSGLVFFSYKIAMEGKETVISLQIHLEKNNYAERIGLKKWMDDNQIPELIDAYITKIYVTVSENVDSLAMYYNMTEIVDIIRLYCFRPNLESSVISSFPEQVNFRPLENLYKIQSRVRNKEWKAIYKDIDGMLREFVSLIVEKDISEKLKAFVLQSLDVSKRVLASGTAVLATSANLLLFVALSIVSGAAGLVNLTSELMIFCWLLYYLITSDSGGVMDHVLGMIPLSRPTRDRCAEVLGHAVSSVLLATAKVTLFQGCLTYLLFRFYRIHFLYMSTFLSLLSAVLPITPAWLASIPAAAQLAMESRYIEAILLTAIHLILLDYGTIAIQDEIPGRNAYLTGLSILGGIALFPSAVEGAIMGPLLLTVMIAMKNLYIEFVLASANDNSQ